MDHCQHLLLGYVSAGAGRLRLQGSLLLLVALLIFIAYHPARRPQDLGGGAVAPRPNVVGPCGLLQSFADLLKFVLQGAGHPGRRRQGRLPAGAAGHRRAGALGLGGDPARRSGWAIANINVGILYIFAISSLGVYGIIMGGWASNSKYPFLGALRSAAQMVSYEVSIGFVIITVLLCAGSLNLSDIVDSAADGLGTLLGLPG